MSGSSSSNPPRKRTKLGGEVVEACASVGDGELPSWFDVRRARLLTPSRKVVAPSSSSGKAAGSVIYWMSRDQRCEDNWAMLFARHLAKRAGVPLRVCFSLVPSFLGASIRHFGFMLGGLEETERQLRAKGVPFHLLRGTAGETIPAFAKEQGALAVVCDMSPLKTPMAWTRDVGSALSDHIPLFQVDAHNVVPVWTASDKQEIMARWFRKRVDDQLDFLTEMPPLERNDNLDESTLPPRPDWGKIKASLDVDRTVAEVHWLRPGWAAGQEVLQSFISKKLKKFNDSRNDPTEDALSNLSPYLHYGQLSAQRVVLEVKAAKKSSDSTKSFVEETVVRRELSDNFCFYNSNYDNLNGASEWARETLLLHSKDAREHIYSKEKLEGAQTHDDLWNAAQIQMVQTGKMHGFLRMYWAKKILEWTQTPQEALDIANYLNNKYELDGRDPSGYVGVAWSIMGTHDMGWTERPIFGKIRYMNYAGCARKFDICAFVNKFPQARTNCVKAGGTPAKPKKSAKKKMCK